MNNSSMTMRPSKFVERGKIDTLTQIHDLSLFHGLHDILVYPLKSLRFVLFVQSLVFCSVFCGPLFVLLSFCFICYSKTNDFWLQPWYLQTVLAIYSKSSQWFYCHLGTDCPFGAPEYSRYSVGNLMLDLSFLCSVL